MSSNKRGFTLVELLVVVGMIAIILGAISVSYSAAQQRARIQKATGDVKVIAQAILAYENFNRSQEDYSLPTYASPVEADANTLSFLIGEKSANGNQIPALLQAQLRSGSKKMLDPWGTPYKLKIKEGTIPTLSSLSALQTGYYLPNFYRLGKGERDL